MSVDTERRLKAENATLREKVAELERTVHLLRSQLALEMTRQGGTDTHALAVMREAFAHEESKREGLENAYNSLLAVATQRPDILVTAKYRRIQDQWPGSSPRFLAAVRQAIRRGHSWDLRPDEYEQLASQPCCVCGGDTGSGVGLDRIDNKIGYVVGNVRPCCGPCNMKRGRQPVHTP